MLLEKNAGIIGTITGSDYKNKVKEFKELTRKRITADRNTERLLVRSDKVKEAINKNWGNNLTKHLKANKLWLPSLQKALNSRSTAQKLSGEAADTRRHAKQALKSMKRARIAAGLGAGALGIGLLARHLRKRKQNVA